MIIEVNFLNGYWAESSDGRAEWPPAPCRLFSALVHGMYNLARSQNLTGEQFLRNALLWLENQAPPEIHFGQNFNKDNRFPTVYCERADGNDEKGKQPTTFPHVYSDHPSVYFSWPGIDPGPHADNLANIMHYVPYVGCGQSFSRVRFADAIPPNLNRITPDENGDLIINCFHPGRLAYLDHRYDNGFTPQPIGSQVSYSNKNRNDQTIFYSYALHGPYRPHISQAAELIAAFRSHILTIAKNTGVEPPTLIGHDKADHCHYLALPKVGHHGNGQIFGLAAVLPKTTDKEACQHVLRLANRQPLSFNKHNWNLTPSFMERNLTTIQRRTWDGPDDQWTSVTPAEVHWLPGDFMTNQPHYETYLKHHCEHHLGLPECQVSVHSHSPLIGVPPAAQFNARSTKMNGDKRQTGYRVHCTIRFTKKIQGPLIIGHGRYFGMGLLKPLRAIRP